MALADVTKEYVDRVSYSKYATRTAVTAEFSAVKTMMSQYLNSGQFPDAKFTHGLALLICHYYAMDDTQNPDLGGSDTNVGPVTTERVGDLTQVRGLQPYVGEVQGFKSWLLQSRYGTEFLYLMRTFKPTPIVL
jgi:hypothetical protein